MDCLEASGQQIAVTGTITGGRIKPAPDFDPTGHTMAITILDGAPDQVGFDVSFLRQPPEIQRCEAVPLLLELDRGDFRLE